MKKLFLLALLVSILILTVCSIASAVNYYRGGSVWMGEYEQDNNTGNGKESIEWIVLDIDGDYVLLISRYAIDARPYNRSYTSVTWEDSSLRAWLNDDFYYSAFSSNERSKIAYATIDNPNNPGYGTYGGRETTDKLYILSISEAKYYFKEGAGLYCEPTKYTKVRARANDSSIGNYNANVWWWWLRTPGSQQQYAATVNTTGGIVNIGYHVDDSYVGVRPVMWIKR